MEKINKNAGGAAIKSPKKGGKQNVIINPPEKVDPTRGFNEAFKKAYDRFVVTVEQKTAIVLQAKANKAHMPEEVIQQVFVRGYKDLPLNTTLTREQYAMNRVNSFLAFGEAFIHDCDLLERVGVKGTGGAMRPHIKREVSPYNGKTIYHVVDKQGRVKHSTTDEYGAKRHLAQKYNTYNEEVDQPVEEAKQMKGEDPCWDDYKMVGTKKKNGKEVPNCVPEEVKLDEERIDLEVRRHNRVLVLTEETLSNSFGEALAGRISSRHFQWLDAPVKMLGAADTPAIPLSENLEKAMLPNAEKTAAILRDLLAF
ncbi:hypothetical protein EBT25_18130 [bacterium]|nr:hypothetical protein [bacterium]